MDVCEELRWSSAGLEGAPYMQLPRHLPWTVCCDADDADLPCVEDVALVDAVSGGGSCEESRTLYPRPSEVIKTKSCKSTECDMWVIGVNLLTNQGKSAQG